MEVLFIVTVQRKVCGRAPKQESSSAVVGGLSEGKKREGKTLTKGVTRATFVHVCAESGVSMKSR